MARFITVLALLLPAQSYGSPIPVGPSPDVRLAQPQEGRHKPRSAENHTHAEHRRGCNTRACFKRVQHRYWRQYTAPYRAWLRSTGDCETRGLSNQGYDANTGNGFYGRYQFTKSSWRSVGGYGYPHNAAPLEQDYRAIRLLHVQGTGAWPVCG